MPEPTTAPSTQPKPQCTAITTDGNRCRNTVLRGLHLCYAHYHHRFPTLADPDHISIPLLEDGASIRLLMTQIAHGLLSKKLDAARARATIWAAQVAASTMPRPPRLQAPANPEPPGEPVHRIAFDHEAMICADGDLSALNHLCSAPATPEEIWAAQDTVLSVNQPVPEQRYTDPWHPAPPPQPIPDPYNVLPPPDPEPRPDHERALPCECPQCLARRAVFLGQFRNPRKKSAPVDNPLCPSGKPTCLGPDSEFCCRACRRLRTPPQEDPGPDQDPLSLEASANPSPSPQIDTRKDRRQETQRQESGVRRKETERGVPHLQPPAPGAPSPLSCLPAPGVIPPARYQPNAQNKGIPEHPRGEGGGYRPDCEL